MKSPKRKIQIKKRKSVKMQDGRRSPRKPLVDISNIIQKRVVRKRSLSPNRSPKRSPKKSPRRSPRRSPAYSMKYRLRDGVKRRRKKSPLKLRK